MIFASASHINYIFLLGNKEDEKGQTEVKRLGHLNGWPCAHIISLAQFKRSDG